MRWSPRSCLSSSTQGHGSQEPNYLGDSLSQDTTIFFQQCDAWKQAGSSRHYLVAIPGITWHPTVSTYFASKGFKPNSHREGAKPQLGPFWSRLDNIGSLFDFLLLLSFLCLTLARFWGKINICCRSNTYSGIGWVTLKVAMPLSSGSTVWVTLSSNMLRQ